MRISERVAPIAPIFKDRGPNCGKGNHVFPEGKKGRVFCLKCAKPFQIK